MQKNWILIDENACSGPGDRGGGRRRVERAPRGRNAQSGLMQFDCKRADLAGRPVCTVAHILRLRPAVDRLETDAVSVIEITLVDWLCMQRCWPEPFFIADVITGANAIATLSLFANSKTC